MKWMLVNLAAAVWLLLVSTGWAQTPAADAVMLVNVPDISGSMVKAVASMTAAEVVQLKRTLRPGDVYARVLFAAEARLSVLQHVRSDEDIANITAVVSGNIAAAGGTSISKGLLAARDAVERAAGNRRVVLVLSSDGVNDPVDGQAAEQRRFAAAAAWWKSRAATDRVLVGIAKPGNKPKLEALAAALGARLVTLDDYQTNPLVERAIAQARAASAPAEPAPVALPAESSSSWWAPSLLVTALVAAAFWWGVLKRKKSLGRPAHSSPPATIVAPEASAPSVLYASVSASGQAQQTIVPVDELEFGTATLGTAGTITVPGLAGAPVAVLVGGDGLTIIEDAGTGIWVNGKPLARLPQPANVGRECRLTYRGVAIALQLRRAGERRSAPPIRVVAHGRRR